jgi:glucosyl-dolichyl phosphate glucuronosyltransferase
MQLSVIIPTRNRAASLARAVRGALALDYPSDHFEIVIVDNASTDQTSAVVRELQKLRGGSIVQYVPEARLGLHHARHAGAQAAAGDILLFTDDDATFSPQWASAYAAAFDQHGDMAAAGGPVHVAWDVPPPQWLTEFIERKEAITGGEHAFGPFSLLDRSNGFLLEPRGYFFGVNMAIRRGPLFELGGFNPEAFGGKWLGDGETGLVFKLWSRSLLIGYVPDAVVNHHMGPERMTVAYLRRRMANQGACDAYSEFHSGMPGRRALARRALKSIPRAAREGVKAAGRWNRTDPASLRAQMTAAQEGQRLAYTVRLIFDSERRALVERDDWLEISATGGPLRPTRLRAPGRHTPEESGMTHQSPSGTDRT